MLGHSTTNDSSFEVCVWRVSICVVSVCTRTAHLDSDALLVVLADNDVVGVDDLPLKT